MKPIAIVNGTIVTPLQQYDRGVLLINGGKIAAVGTADQVEIPADAVRIDAADQFVAPGYVDSHTHGGFGYDYMDINQEQLAELLSKLPSKGVTSVVPTLASASLEEQAAMLEVLKEGQRRSPLGAKIAGVHLEGSYLAPQKRGAQPLDALRMPSVEEMRHLLAVGEGLVCLVTLAPELPGSLEVIEYLAGQGVVVSAGHTSASYEEIEQAVERGLSRVAHLFNGMDALHHREPGTVGAALTLHPIFAEVILDGIHLDPRIVKLAVLAKGIDRVLLITDSMEATGMGDGSYIRPGNRHVVVKDGVARLESGSLAGSVLTMDRAVQNAVNLAGLPVADAIRLASYNPAENLGFNDRGVLAAGKQADVLVLSRDLSVETVLVQGEIVFQRSLSGGKEQNY